MIRVSLVFLIVKRACLELDGLFLHVKSDSLLKHLFAEEFDDNAKLVYSKNEWEPLAIKGT
jgi:hypothetical protein